MSRLCDRPPKALIVPTQVIINKHMSQESPRIDAQVFFDEIGIVMDRDQYRDALSTFDVFHFYRRTHQYHLFRPPEKEFTANPARARLKFAMTAISSEIHDRRKRWTWGFIAERRERRIKYADIYIRKLFLPENKQLSSEVSIEMMFDSMADGFKDGAILTEMEHNLPYEDIRFFRSVARARAKQDEATRQKLEAERKKSQPQKQSWGQWLWGGPSPGNEDGGMSEADKKEIDDIIDYNADEAHAKVGTTPKDFMQARIAAKLNKGSLSLRTDPHGKNEDMIALVFDSFSADAVQLTESVSARMALGGFRVYDGTTPGSLYPQIVRVKDIESNSKGKGRQTSLEHGGTGGAMDEISDGLNDEDDPFFICQSSTTRWTGTQIMQ